VKEIKSAQEAQPGLQATGPVFTTMSALSDAWLSNPWLVWGVGSYIASVVGFLLTATVLEVVIRSSVLDSSLLSYASSKYRSRKTVLAETYTRLPFK
jgi:hypothetical protein